MKLAKSAAADEKIRSASVINAFQVTPAFSSCPIDALESTPSETESSGDRPVCHSSDFIKDASRLAKFLKFMIRVCILVPEAIPAIFIVRPRNFFYQREHDRYIKFKEEKRAELNLYVRRF